MVYENFSADTLREAVDKISAYFDQWEPKLYDTEVAEFKKDREGNWQIVMTRDGNFTFNKKS